MRTLLTSGLTALLTGVAAAPLATGFTMLSADAVYAKSDNAGGKGNSAGKGKSGQNEKSGGKGNSGSKGGGKGKGKNAITGFFDKLTGKEKAAANKGGKKTVGTTGMHPSELGNMNGALNANINAVLAHVKNGNTNGPVGLVAVLAVANSNAEGAAEIVSSPEAAEYSDVHDAVAANPDYETVEDYMTAKAEGGEDFVVDPDIEGALAAVGTGALNSAVDNNETYDTASDYFIAKESGAEGFVEDPDIEAAAAGLGDYDPTKAQEFKDAEDALVAVADAEAGIISGWNKQPTGTEEEVQAKQDALIQGINDRLLGHEGAIATAIEDSKTHGDDDDGDMAEDGCEEGSEGCEPADDDVAMVAE